MRGFSFLQIIIDVLVETWGVYMKKAPTGSWNARIYAFLRRNLRYYCLASALLMTILIWNLEPPVGVPPYPLADGAGALGLWLLFLLED